MKPSKPDRRFRPRASQWSFIKPHFTDAGIEYIANLPTTHVTYINYAIIDNDNDSDNRHIEGFVKIPFRCRINFLQQLIGPAIFRTVGTSGLVETLKDIHSNDLVEEHGDSTKLRHRGIMREVRAVKPAIKSLDLLDELENKCPKIFTDHPRLMLKPFNQLKK